MILFKRNDDIKRLRYIIDESIPKQTLIIFLIGSVLMGFIEMIGILSVIPFIGVVIDNNNIYENGYLLKAYNYLRFSSEFYFVVFLGFASFVALIISNLFIAFMNWKIFQITRRQEHVLSTKLLKKYLNNNYSFYLENNSSELEKNLLSEVTRVINDVFLPGITAISKLSIVFFIIVVLLFSEPFLAMSVFSAIFILYLSTYMILKRPLTKISNMVADKLGEKFKIISEIFAGIREIKLDSYENYFAKNYENISLTYSDKLAKSLAIGALPRYILEALAFGGIILIVLFLYISFDDTSHIISLIALYALAGYRMLPAAQSIYFAFSKYKFGKPALEIIYHGLKNEDYEHFEPKASNKLISKENILEIEDVSFSYKNSNTKAIYRMNISVKGSNLIGIIGPSGSGKSTLMDITLGLLDPDKGNLHFKRDQQDEFEDFKRSIGYISQNVFISDDTVTRNIAFGKKDSEINFENVLNASKLANIHDHIMNLPNEYSTYLGKAGSSLSGGQKQRIAIARALYKNPQIVIFDEATSQLDVPTERQVFESIKSIKNKITVIIITHRVSILKDCDEIHVINKGKLDQSGTYDKLLKSNKLFQSFVNIDS